MPMRPVTLNINYTTLSHDPCRLTILHLRRISNTYVSFEHSAAGEIRDEKTVDEPIRITGICADLTAAIQLRCHLAVVGEQRISPESRGFPEPGRKTVRGAFLSGEAAADLGHWRQGDGRGVRGCSEFR